MIVDEGARHKAARSGAMEDGCIWYAGLHKGAQDVPRSETCHGAQVEENGKYGQDDTKPVYQRGREARS